MSRGAFNAGQREVLLRPIMPQRVSKDRNGLSHLEGYDVESHLSRVFGFEGWDKDITKLWLIGETAVEKNGRTGYNVTYGCQLRLTIYSPDGLVACVRDGAATGSANNLPSYGDAHDFAMKNSVTYALKVASKTLGDQFGLSLYDKGSLGPIVGKVVPYSTDA
jgi:recombination DNA repair RAD52 pathway protein